MELEQVCEEVKKGYIAQHSIRTLYNANHRALFHTSVLLYCKNVDVLFNCEEKVELIAGNFATHYMIRCAVKNGKGAKEYLVDKEDDSLTEEERQIVNLYGELVKLIERPKKKRSSIFIEDF